MIVVQIGRLAQQLGVHRNTIRNWIRSGKLPARGVPGKRYLISEEDFHKLCHAFGLDPESIAVRRIPMKADQESPPQEPSVPLTQLKPRTNLLRASPQWADVCLTCGSCASACPISAVDGLDPRKVVRMAVLGLENQLLESDWVWKCTLCGKCEEACPMNVEIVSLIRAVRGKQPRDRVPVSLQRGLQTCLETGNNLGIPQEDFVGVCLDLADELVEEGWNGFRVPLDVKGARVLVTVNSKEPFADPDDMKFLWKVLHAAGESWTLTTEHWEGLNWAYFTGDDQTMRALVARLVDQMARLECRTLLLPL
ncbi:DNA binding domain-containing protein, excisionase family [Desulfacinum hydrothermale DSM 13146]|uniref:DNA binding domain-containing protein, excisionase family n=2 Tax=Desulfacinum hydrothermale TaxID=109258 RepID=A0A1W1XJC1_9BACT|nr:DNA binding domain-containing protein, excisionase family [Desulfacinum hydrothermale DSM 13146]